MNILCRFCLAVMAFVLTRLLVSYFEAISAHDQMVLTEDVLFDTSFTQL